MMTNVSRESIRVREKLKIVESLKHSVSEIDRSKAKYFFKYFDVAGIFKYEQSKVAGDEL